MSWLNHMIGAQAGAARKNQMKLGEASKSEGW